MTRSTGWRSAKAEGVGLVGFLGKQVAVEPEDRDETAAVKGDPVRVLEDSSV